MSDSIPPLDPELLGPLREADPAPADVRARARQRLMAAVGGMGGLGGPGGGGAGGGPAGGTGAAAWTGAARMTTAIAFVLGGVVGAGLYAAFAPVPARPIVYVDRMPPALPGVPTPVPVPTPAPAPSSAVVEAPIANVAPLATAAPSSRASQLSAERILLDEARAALAQGDPERAMDRLERHRRTFAAPLLGEERDAMWIEALVKAGRYDEARARAATFRKRSQDSLFESLVDSAIDSIP